MNRLPLVLGALLLVTACGGPERSLDLGFKEVPSDVVLGAQSSPTASAPASSAPAVTALPLPPPPSVVTLPPPPFELPQAGPEPAPPSPLPSAPSCPPVDQLAAPKLEATSSISKPPAPAAYLFDNVGTFSVSGANARRGMFPARSLRVVGNVVAGSGAFSYDVTERIGDTTTTTTFRVSTGAAVENGLFIVKETYRRIDGEVASFTPAPPLKLAALPLVRGASTDQRAVDPQTQTAMSFTSTVEGKSRIFACGEPLDSWTVHLTTGRLISPTQDLQFDATYSLGTQFGGLVLRDAIAFTGTDGDAGVQRSNRATISTVPK
ncbi:MAG: hypothetical protein LC789_12890 [Actinobacteria bacterium]|nr:hypothetical protein [Actinomycetota bacterium]